MSEPTYYPEMPCHLAPLREKRAPLAGCECRVCRWLRGEPTKAATVAEFSGVTGRVAATVAEFSGVTGRVAATVAEFSGVTGRVAATVVYQEVTQTGT